MQTLDIASSGPVHRIRAQNGMDWEAAPVTDGVWEDVLEASPEPHLTQTPSWTGVVVEATGARNVTRLYRSADGRRMVLPLIAGGPSRLAAYRSLPHGWGRGGPVGDGTIDHDAIGVVLDDLIRLGGIAVRIRTQPEREDTWAGSPDHGFSAIPRITHISDISRGAEHIWTTVFSGRTRTKIRKATKAGVHVEHAAGAAFVPVFYEIYEVWMRERAERRHVPAAALRRAVGRLREPRRKFDVAARRISDNLRIWIAYLDDRPIAAAIQLIYDTHSTYWRSYSVREIAGRSRANYLLQWRMMEEACRLGCRTHDMGESGGVESLMHFKEVFGATPRPYRELYRERVPVTGPGLAVRAAVIDRVGRRGTRRAAHA